jgi:hypothetical protein
MPVDPTERLRMIALGIRGDQPVDPEQPPLVDGVHCRWSPAQELGFPWYGFYLFRRETRPKRRCLKQQLVADPPSLHSVRHETTIGTLSSATPLTFTDDFPEPGTPEVDLRAPIRFELPADVETNRFDLRVGFRETPRIVRTCADFRKLPIGSAPTPRTEQGAVFTVQPVSVVTQPPDAAIEQWTGGPAGLEFTSPVAITYRLDIALPCRAMTVDLLLSNRDAIVVRAFEADGVSAGVQRFDTGVLKSTKVTMTGKAIDHLTIESTSVDSTLVHEVCWECLAAGGATIEGPEILVDFRPHPRLEFPNPVIDQGVHFESQETPGTRAPLAWFDALGHGVIGLHDRARLDIRLPCATKRAEMLITKATDGTDGTLTAFNEDTSVAQNLVIHTFGQSTYVVEGQAITRIQIDAPFSDVLLHTLAFRCFGKAKQTIRVRGLLGTDEVTQLDMTAEEGQIVVTAIHADAMNAIELASGNAALIELCYTPTRQPQTFGWEEVPGFQYPLCLPVADDDYPCPGKPADLDAARILALSRVTYPAPEGREEGFWELHEQLVRLVRHGPAGGAMADRTIATLPGHSQSAATQEAPSISDFKPLDLVFLASLYPAYAQMLGLYFVDQDVPPGVAYDYLILADATGILGGSAKSALDWLAHDGDLTTVDSDLLFDRSAEPRAPVASPQGVRAYALPGPAAREIDGTLPAAAGNVGLWWQLPPETDDEEPDRIIFYDVRRAFFGAMRPASAPDASQYEHAPRLASVLVSEPDPPPAPNPRNSDWPPSTIPIHVIDGNLAEGWWGYRLAGQTLFGRRSAAGPPAEWYQWDPSAGTPAPWYWKTPAGHRSIDPFAVGLLDKMPPPTPLGVEAWALDPDDRWLYADTDYWEWRKTVAPQLVGLRVQWRWRHEQQLAAPDTHEFRIYQQPGRWNTILAIITQVVSTTATESDVLLDIADAHSADAFKDARLRVGNDDFAILASTPGSQLQLRVKNIGAVDDVRPPQNEPCSITIPAGHALFVDTSKPASWLRRLTAVPYDPPQRVVLDPSKDADGKLLTSIVFNGAPLAINGLQATLPSPAQLSGIQPWIDHLWLKDANNNEELRRIVRYDTALRMVTVESATTLTPAVWAIGRPAREYEVFLPAPDTGLNEPFMPSASEPVVYAQIAVSAADDKTHASDTWPGQPLGNRIGNESPLSPSATVYRVLNATPDAPELPAGPDRLLATAADWADRSYSTFRFLAKPDMRVHILRALDESLFERDWLIRETREKLDPSEHLALFPDWPDDLARRTAAAIPINGLANGNAYSTLTKDAWELLPLLPGNEGHPEQQALETRDREMRRFRGQLARTDPVFLNTWNDATRDAIAAELNAITKRDDYAKLTDNAIRTLANVPGNEAAFTQVTLDPLEMNAPSLIDNRRADDSSNYTSPATNIRAYTDTLPGRATNRYLYRALFVDRAQNVGAMSLAGAPVYLRKVEPPPTPVITRVVGGDRQITIEWARSREGDLSHYRVYRSRSDRAHDIRHMVLVHIEPAPTTETVSQIGWSDHSVTAYENYIYRLTAVDTQLNESSPSTPYAMQAFDYSAPEEPAWERFEWIESIGSAANQESSPVIILVFSTSQSGVSVLCERDTAGSWQAIGPWLASPTFDETRGVWEYSIIDATAAPTVDHRYRLKLVTRAGMERVSEVLLISAMET